MYTGLILIATGVAAASADSTRMLLALGLLGLLTFKSEFEEKGLVELYGDRYRTYQRQVRRFGFL
jgi:protein-S-isoprenylcysteine O-methyltransferase Ste14